MAGDLGHQFVATVDAQPQQLVGSPGRQALLELPAIADHLVWHAGVTQQLQQGVQRFGQRCQRVKPGLQVGTAPSRQALLPGVVSRQIEPTGSGRDADAASHTGKPLMAGQ